MPGTEGLRWRLAEDDGGQPMLFDEEDLVDRHVGIGEYRGLEFLHVNAKRVMNPVPASSRMDFRYTINAYRGCSHACVYCSSGDSLVLMADGRTKPLGEVVPGDEVVGTARQGRYRRYVTTTVLDHWATRRRAYRTLLDDGTALTTSGDHRFLSNRGWKYVTGDEDGPLQRPFLTPSNWLLGPGRTPAPPVHDADYRRGYLTGIIRGDGSIGAYEYRSRRMIHAFRLAMADVEVLLRCQAFLMGYELATRERVFATASALRREMRAVETHQRVTVEEIRRPTAWPSQPTRSWRRGFLAGIFDAEGGYDQGILRISNSDAAVLGHTVESLRTLGFRCHVEVANHGPNRLVRAVRVVGGLSEHIRFFSICDPAITRKRTWQGNAVKNSAERRVVSVTSLGLEMPMYDITTGTGDFVMEGVISHNCFARPTHEYLGFNAAEDFERKIVVKVNAVERVRAELRSPKWGGHLVAMGTNTDPYQHAEGKYHLTRGIVEALAEARNPFSILTKSTLILRDLKLLASAAQRTDVRCAFSIGTLDEAAWRATEPGTPPPRRRVEAVRKLNDAGVHTGVLIAPIIPGLSDRPEQVAEVAEACLDAGAASVTALPLHLRPGVKEVFLGALDGKDPRLAGRLRARYGPRSYLPQAEQSRITQPVRAAIDRRAGPS